MLNPFRLGNYLSFLSIGIAIGFGIGIVLVPVLAVSMLIFFLFVFGLLCSLKKSATICAICGFSSFD